LNYIVSDIQATSDHASQLLSNIPTLPLPAANDYSN
jgi:hypothetical protein